MPRPVTVDDLVNQVRDQIDEANTETISDADILQALNRAQDYGVDILARHYPDPFMVKEDLTLTSGTAEYTLPEGTFEDRLKHVEIIVDGEAYEVRRVSISDATNYESSGTTDIPRSYTMFGRTLRFYPTPAGTYNARVWRMTDPETLVQQQGRITTIDVASDYLLVNSVGDDLSTSTDNLAAYVNVVDAQTGEIKVTLQVSALDSGAGKVTIKSSPDRTSVWNRTVAGAIPTTVAADDYVCLVDGTCVPYFPKPMSNFIIQYAVEEIRRRLSDNPDIEQRVLKEFEQQIERTWAGRDQQRRIKRRSNNWFQRSRYWFRR